MLRYSFLFFSLLLFADQNTTSLKKLRYLYEQGIRDYRIGSYYDALDEFNYLAKNPRTPFYLDSLKYLAKTYLQIGKRTGEKRYLWSARNFLNTYLARGGAKDWDYYYTKAYIFEILGFYERALANYKIALKLTKNKKERLKIIIGILRSAVWLKKLDLATRYIVILDIENLSKTQKKEFEFLQGMYHFVKGEYAKAIELFQKSYRENEPFLIENPNYYYIVAETAYRIGDLTFAQRLFRRILNYVKNKEVIEKSLLRMGDIKFLQGEYRAGSSYYYRLIKDFPDTPYATIAKLKVLYLMKSDKKMAHYIKKFMKDAAFLEHPQQFVIQTLVRNRDNYIGAFALANFGLSVFDLESDKLFKRLAWELSLLSVEKLKFEHIEYFRRLWQGKLLQLKPKHLCELLRANEDFFFKVFEQKALMQMIERVKKCDKKLYIHLLKEAAKRYPQKSLLLEVVQVLYDNGLYEDASKVLKRVKERDCQVLLWSARICYIQNDNCKSSIEEYLRACPKESFYKRLFEAVDKDEYGAGFLRSESSLFLKYYKKDPLVRKYLRRAVERLIQKRAYGDIVALLSPLRAELREDCFLNSVLALSYIRSGKIEYAKEILANISRCDDPWYEIAAEALEDQELKQKVYNVGKDR